MSDWRKEIEINREYDQKGKGRDRSFNGYVVHGEKLFYVMNVLLIIKNNTDSFYFMRY